MFQDKKENGCRGNRNNYNTLKIDQMQRKKCKLYRIMFVCCKTSKKFYFGNWKEITAMTAIITKISQNTLLSHKIMLHNNNNNNNQLYLGRVTRDSKN